MHNIIDHFSLPIAYLVTYDQAATETIHRVVQLATKKYGSEHIITLYERVKRGYNDYVQLIGGAIEAGPLKQGNKMCSIADNLSLLHFLTGECLKSIISIYVSTCKSYD